MQKRFAKGFTLIELLIVIAIIGILSGLAVAGLQGNLSRARDTQRRNDLKQLQNALQAYFNDCGHYPVVAGWSGTSSAFGSHTNNAIATYNGAPIDCAATLNANATTDWIPGLAPKYIRTLPADPRDGQKNATRTAANCVGANAAICQQCATTANYSNYIYYSNGTDYKILTHCTPEGQLNNTNDALYDPVRPSYAWQISTDNFYNTQ